MSDIQALLEKRYFKSGESDWLDVAHRVARFLYPHEEYMQTATERLIGDKVFIPSSPVLMNAGSEYPMMCSCFVLPINDSIEAIMQTLWNTVRIQKYGGGVGINFSNIRPEGSIVRTTGGKASGPVSFMEFWNAGMNVIRQGGKRQGAMMGVLDVNHPDLDLFLDAKGVEGKLTNFNLSVALSGEFMAAASEEDSPERRTLRSIAEHAHSNGEPGVLFMDNINAHNPYGTCIEATNPCGEVPLPPYGACCLGSINLNAFIYRNPHTGSWDFDWVKLLDTSNYAAAILNQVLDKTWWPLREIQEFETVYRPIGLGVMGLADVLALLSMPYDSESARHFAARIIRTMYAGAHGADAGNATLLSIAPTGSIAMIADASYSIEPYFSLSYTKHVEAGEYDTVSHTIHEVARNYQYELTGEDWLSIQQTGSLSSTGAPDEMKHVLRTANEISWKNHLLMQAAVQDGVDNAVSKTINLPTETTVDEIVEIILMAHTLGLKGLTVYRNKSREVEVISCPTGTCEL